MKVHQLCLPLLLLSSLWLSAQTSQPNSASRDSAMEALSSDKEPDPGFARATEIRKFVFPKDEGPHRKFQTEWWYYTGNLKSQESGEHFGFQLTFFRRALTPTQPKRSSSWASNQIYFAHFAISDIAKKKFYHEQRFSRRALGLAGARSTPLRVWLEDWVLQKTPEGTRLVAKTPEFAIDLLLKSQKPIVLQGKQGLSQKSSQPGNASYYYAKTRLASTGTITVPRGKFQVEGLSWLDREWSTSALSKEQSGWDWFALQLDDQREIMLYQLRLKNGGIDPYSSGSLVAADGSKTHLEADDFHITVLDSWQSPETNIIYPSGWRIQIPSQQVDLTVTPLQKNQELNLDFQYWEGAVKVQGKSTTGYGYVELTGYSSQAIAPQQFNK